MTDGGGGLRIEIVATPERLAEIGPAWTALWSQAGRSVFQSHAWVEAWWRTLPAERRPRLRIALAWTGEDLAAVLPLVVQRRRGLRALEWAAKDHTDYCDALVAFGPGSDDVLHRLWAAVVVARGFDLAYLSHLQPDAAILPTLDRAGAGALPMRLSHRRGASLRVQSSWPTGRAWFDSLPKKTRQNYRRGHKIMGEFGAVSYREIAPGEPLGPVLDRLADLKRDWLVRTGQRSTLLDDGAAPFRALVQVLADRGLLRVFVLECDGAIAAGCINFVERRRMMAFLAAYDPTFERASIGTVLMTDYMMTALDDGIEEIDFLCGAEEYKGKFATSRVELVALMGGRTLGGRAAVTLDGWGPILQLWRSRARQAWASRRRPANSPDEGLDGQPRQA